MARLRHPGVRRIIAALLTWCFVFAVAEVRIADVHDGDASHAEVDLLTGTSHATQDVLGGHHGPASSADGGDHALHVCHCTHTHAGVLAASGMNLPVREQALPERMAADLLPPTVALDPPTHPPTA